MNYEPVFISGWFCSGTTALWSAYRRLPGHVAYYEPLHANLAAHIEHTRPKPSHVGVQDYWQAYQQLEQGRGLHCRSFAYQRLILSSEESWPELRQWLQALMAVKAKRHVLKFNRVAFRLPWLKKNWPEAKIVHLRRNVRDAWVSTRRHLPPEQWDDADHVDAYETAQTAWALANDLPVLLSPEASASAYHRFFLLWTLAEQVAAAHADIAIDLEGLKREPFQVLDSLAQLGALDQSDIALAVSAISDSGHAGHTEFRSESWFDAIERAAQTQMEAMGLFDFPVRSLAQIKASKADVWREQFDQMQTGPGIQRLLLELSLSRDSAIAAHAKDQAAQGSD